ncbi:MAG: selenocysteine-specific translation elongation factor [Coriobacteriia bacterium]|nr:selenocysteine-specific translation elongation factor [Coriobacteriia bacterium]MCL2536896.1 selenocysteine-specific translation elongation factor [Coriobacteriia bacterium]
MTTESNNQAPQTAPLPSFILGTAGHIDHGKSTLVQTLTGTDTDRLAEEKRRGITIELGFARLDLPSGAVAGVVDVPGHERFVRHMVEGATGVDVALLVVAADDGVMVQTREHLAILELLGVQQLVVTVTKTDLVDPDLVELAQLDVGEMLAASRFPDTEIVPVSAHSGEGLDALLVAIEACASTIKRDKGRDFVRLPIDRVFSIEGAGTVVTGTLWDGSIKPEDQLELLQGSDDKASTRQVRVRSVQVHGQQVAKAVRGQRVALNLGGIKREDIKRGEMLTSPGILSTTSRFISQLHYDGLAGGNGQTPPLKDGSSLILHHGTNETAARVKFLFHDERVNELASGQTAYVQLRLDKALPLRYADRFIVRSLSPAYTVGGGTVLLTDVGQRTKLSPAWFELFDQLAQGDTDKSVLNYLELTGLPASAAELAGVLGLQTAIAARILNQSELARLKTDKETFYLSAAALDAVFRRVCEQLVAYHGEHPQALSISIGALHGLTFPRIASTQARAWSASRFEVLLTELAHDGQIKLDGGKVSHPEAASSVQALHDEVSTQLLADITSQGLAVSTVAEHVQRTGHSRDLVSQVLGQLLRDEKLIRIASEYYFAPEHIAAAAAALEAELQARADDDEPGMTAAEIRDLWAISRKYAIPLLEYFDARGLTRRDGDLRYLKS